jgi:hypothetical protein
MTFCWPIAQVFCLSGCCRIIEHWFLAGGSRLGAFSDGIPAARFYDMVSVRRQYGLRECTRVLFPILLSTYATAHIVCLVCFLDLGTKLSRMISLRFYMSVTGYSSTPTSADNRSCDADGSFTS